MHKSTAIRTGVASAVAAAGLAVGGVAVANAADSTATPSAPSAESGRPGPGDGGPGGHGPGGPARDDAALAKALGVSKAKLQAAQKAVREDLKPSKPADGEKPDRAADESKRIAALAKELGLSEAKVKAAFESVRAAHDKERRSDLSDRLDQAVEDGKLTSDDKASVLKAFDADVLGGPGPR